MEMKTKYIYSAAKYEHINLSRLNKLYSYFSIILQVGTKFSRKYFK